jgi:hypothetical protein
MDNRFSRWVARRWADVAHPERRGAPNPATQQIFIAMIALGSALLAIDTLTAPTKTTTSGSALNPNEGLFVAGLVIVGLGVLGLILLAIPAFFAWQEDRSTPFSLHHDLKCLECEENRTDHPWQMLRVGVTNTSSGGVQRVRVFMRVLEGEGRSAFLHLQHDNEPARQASRNGDYLTIGQTSHFDVALVKREHDSLWLYYADADISELSRVQLRGQPMEWKLRLEVSGWINSRDVVPTNTIFRLAVDAKQHMTLTAQTSHKGNGDG